MLKEISKDDIARELAMHGLSSLSAIGAKVVGRAPWNDLLDDRNTIRRGMRSMLSGAEKAQRQFSPQEAAAFDEANTILDNIQTEIDKRHGSGSKDPRGPAAMGNGPRGDGSRRMPADRAKTMLGPKDRLADVFAGQPEGPGIGELLRASITGDWSEGLEQYQAQSIGNGPSGGFMVPNTLSARIIDLARVKARVIEAGATTIPIFGPTTFATVEQDPTAYWRGENEPIPESEMAFGGRTFTPQTLAALVRCSIELLEDAPNLEALIESSLSAQMALQLDRMCLIGDGIGKPLGLINTPGINVIGPVGANGDVLVGYGPLSRAVQAVRANNAEPGDFLMASRTAGELDRLTDSTGQPLQPPKSVADRQFLVTNQVDTNMTVGTASNAAAIFTGQWPDLYVAMRTNITIEASRVADTTMKNMQVLIRAYIRADAFAVRPNHFSAITGVVPPA